MAAVMILANGALLLVLVHRHIYAEWYFIVVLVDAASNTHNVEWYLVVMHAF